MKLKNSRPFVAQALIAFRLVYNLYAMLRCVFWDVSIMQKKRSAQLSVRIYGTAYRKRMEVISNALSQDGVDFEYGALSHNCESFATSCVDFENG